jgi:hypothetical protein
MKYIVSISGGLGSAEALRRAIAKYGKENVIAVFADVKGTGEHTWLGMPTISKLLHERFGGESHDTYRFIWMLAYHFDIPIERLETGLSIWDIFAKKKAFRLVVNGAFFCPASEELKRAVITKWAKASFTDESYSIVLGMDWDEHHRIVRSQYYWRESVKWNVNVISLNSEKPYASKEETALYFLKNELDFEFKLPSAYEDGADHNNCHWACVNAGQGHFAALYLNHPLHYHYWAWMESRIQKYIKQSYTILKDTRGGVTTRLSLYQFIDRIERGDYLARDASACACMGNIPQLEDYVKATLEKPKQISMFEG